MEDLILKDQSSTPRFLTYGSPIDLSDAKKVAAAAEAEALQNGWAVVICIVDSTGHIVLMEKLDQAQYGSIEIARAKAETALDFKRPTKVFEEGIAQGGIGVRCLSMHNVCALEGGIPLMRDGKIIGAIGVSGVKTTEDAQVANAGASAIS
jgi:glc operon protein GlcG